MPIPSYRELVTLVLFSKKLDDLEKKRCAQAMLRYYEVDMANITGKLVTPLLKSTTSLHSLFGKESWIFFRLCGVKGKSYLPLPVSLWSENDDYQLFLGVARNYVVVNDVAERALLLAKMLQNKLTKKPDMKDKLVNIIPKLQKLVNANTKSDLFIDIHAHLMSL